jgi:hypothetical protein
MALPLRAIVLSPVNKARCLLSLRDTSARSLDTEEVRMAKRISVAIAIAVALVVSARLASADADRPYGIVSHLTGHEYDNRAAIASALAGANIKLVRVDFGWWSMEQPEGTWNYAVFDDVVSTANANGIQLIAILGWPPPWGSPAHANVPKWRAYIANVVNRYKGVIKYWEVTNEINLLVPSITAANYVTMLSEAHSVIKGIDPALTVLFSGLGTMRTTPWSTDYQYLEDCYAAGARGKYDVMNIHPYRWSFSQTEPDPKAAPEGAGPAGRIYEEVAQLRSFLDGKNDRAIPIWVTEVGYPTSVTSQANQAKWLPRTILSLLQARVERVIWYEYLDNPNPALPAAEQTSGLRPNLTATKPAWNTYRTLVSMRPPGSGSLNPSDWHNAQHTTFYAKWLRPDGLVGWALWTTGATVTYQLHTGGGLHECYDQFGVVKTCNAIGGGNISVGINSTVTYVLAATSTIPKLTGYYRIKNAWNGQYVYQDANVARYSASPSTQQNSHWNIEVHNGNRRFKNRVTGQYLHIENLLPNVQVGPTFAIANSSQWQVLPINGSYRLRSAWNGDYAHIEGLPGYVRRGTIWEGWSSPLWSFEVAP